MTAPRNPDLLIHSFIEEGLVELPDRAFDAVRADIHRTRQRVVIGPWKEPNMVTIARLAVAAAVVVALGVVWINLNQPGGSTGGPPTPEPTLSSSPSPVPSPSAFPIGGSFQELPPGRHYFDYGAATGSQEHRGLRIFITVPTAGWTNYSDFAVDKNYGPTDAEAGASFVVWHITNVYRDPCTDHVPASPVPGADIDELLERLASQDGLEAGPLTDVTIDGYAGKFVELTITTDIATCPGGFYTWGSETDGRFAQGNDEVVRVYALDVDGARLTFFARIPARTTAADRAELESVIDSIDIDP